jgi:hypothetical protein
MIQGMEMERNCPFGFPRAFPCQELRRKEGGDRVMPDWSSDDILSDVWERRCKQRKKRWDATQVQGELSLLNG